MKKATKRFMPQDLRGVLVNSLLSLSAGKITTTEANARSSIANQLHKSARFTTKTTVLARI